MKIYIQHCIRYEQGKNAKTYKSIYSVLSIVSHNICKYWFWQFKAGNFNINNWSRLEHHEN